MLAFVDLAQNALDRHPALLLFLQSWIEPIVGKFKVLSIEEWFQEGHASSVGKRITMAYGYLNTPPTERRMCGLPPQ